MCSLPEPDRRSSTHPVDVGDRTEAAILAELVRRGYTVLKPFGTNNRYDVVVDCGGRFIRAQCKTGRLRRGVVLFATKSTRVNTRGAYSRGYDGEVDLFLVYCSETETVYAVPAEDASVAQGSLRISPTANGQSRRIRWAKDYELPPLAVE
jgi:hypothetical protein